MSALRLARAFTGRDKIVKFAGGYHGHADMLLVQAGSGQATLGLADSPGVPVGAMYQAGTLSGNPLAMATGLATLAALRDERTWPRMEAVVDQLVSGIQDAAASADVPVVVNRVGTMFSPFFQAQAVHDYSSAQNSDSRRFAAFFAAMLERGIYLPPSQFESWFISTSHGEREIEKTIAAAREAFGVVGG